MKSLLYDALRSIPDYLLEDIWFCTLESLRAPYTPYDPSVVNNNTLPSLRFANRITRLYIDHHVTIQGRTFTYYPPLPLDELPLIDTPSFEEIFNDSLRSLPLLPLRKLKFAILLCNRVLQKGHLNSHDTRPLDTSVVVELRDALIAELNNRNL